MPVLAANQVTLTEVLEVKGSPLNEEEIWAVLSQAGKAIERVLADGKGKQHGQPSLLISPDTLILSHSGRVKVSTHVGREKAKNPTYRAPELSSRTISPSDGAVEKMYVYSLGMTLYYAAEYALNKSKMGHLSVSLGNLLLSMCEELARSRYSLRQVLAACGSKYGDRYYSKIIKRLVVLVLGTNIPEVIQHSDVDKETSLTRGYISDDQHPSRSLRARYRSSLELPSPPLAYRASRGQVTSEELIGSNDRTMTSPEEQPSHHSKNKYMTKIPHTLGVNAARNTLADKLKDGDIRNEKWRKIIIEDLHDINTKIDGLSRKDLLASCAFLKEGIGAFKIKLKEANGDHNIENETTTAAQTNERESGVLNEAIALSTNIQRLNDPSNGPLASTEKYFTAAREEATRAFCNEALSLPDRIMAVKLRVVSKILECLQDTKVAVAGCMLFLEELHNLPAIGETFSTYFKGGIKSRFYKDSRLENVKSVLSLNFAILEFVATFSGELPNVRNWPRIHLSTRETIHPLLLDVDVVKDIFDNEEFQPPENQTMTSDILYCYRYCINSKGQLLVSSDYDMRVHMFNRSGKTRTFCRIQPYTANRIKPPVDVFGGMAFVIDRDDKVFVIKGFKDCTSGKYVFVLFVFDSSGNKQYERMLHFLERDTAKRINCVINNDDDIVIHLLSAFDLYVCDKDGNLKSTLSLEKYSSDDIWDDVYDDILSGIPCVFLIDAYDLMNDYFQCVSVTNQNEIVMREGEKVFVYTNEGKLKRTIIVKNGVSAVAYNYDTSNLEIMEDKESTFGTRRSFCIRTYSENDEVEYLYLPINKCYSWKAYCSHPTGPAALIYCRRLSDYVDEKKVIFL